MTHVTTPATLSVGSVTIREHNGLYSLNDLHRASGNEANHQPAYFIRREETKALIAELSKSANSQIYNPIESRRGGNGGTYACRELVIAYAAWISAAFHLKVIRVFLDTMAPPQPSQIPPLPAPEPAKGLSPEVAQEIAAQASQSILDALQKKNLLVDWQQVIDALTDRNTTITFHELTDLTHACLTRLQRNVNAEAYECIARRAANQGVSTMQVSMNA